MLIRFMTTERAESVLSVAGKPPVRQEGDKMGNLTAFLNSFLSYLLVFAVFAAAGGAAAAIGIQMRRRKNRKEAQEAKEKQDSAA